MYRFASNLPVSFSIHFSRVHSVLSSSFLFQVFLLSPAPRLDSQNFYLKRLKKGEKPKTIPRSLTKPRGATLGKSEITWRRIRLKERPEEASQWSSPWV
jgi:hypothetical protein